MTSESGVTTKTLVRDADDPATVAIVKWGNANVGAYSLGIERVAYVLGDALGLPIPRVHLETYKGNVAAVVERIPNHAEYLRAKNISLLWSGVSNKAVWPLAVAFDIWLANYDRRSANLIIGPTPPQTRPALASSGACWLVDHGLCGLWYPGKIDVALERTGSKDVEAIADPTASFTPTALTRFRDVMQAELVEYRRSFTDLGGNARDKVLDQIHALADDQVERAVREVPETYFSSRSADLTLQFLVARKQAIYTLSREVWPT